MVYAPLAIPAPPAPAMARPTIKVVEFLATAHTRLPISKIIMLIKNELLSGKYLYALPQVDWNEAIVRKKAEPYQPTWSREWNWSVIRGIAVATIVMSMATRKIESARATMIIASRKAAGYSPSSLSDIFRYSFTAPAPILVWWFRIVAELLSYSLGRDESYLRKLPVKRMPRNGKENLCGD
jgi:hypothetical protein